PRRSGPMGPRGRTHGDVPIRPRRVPRLGRTGPMARPDAARNLLFGLLALQNGFIDREALLNAFAAWVADKDRPIADLLVERRALTPALRGVLDARVDEHVRRHDGDPERSLAAVNVGRSTRRSLAALADPDVERTLTHVGPGSTADDPDRTPTFDVGAAA